jgi:hypothetical protein
VDVQITNGPHDKPPIGELHDPLGNIIPVWSDSPTDIRVQAMLGKNGAAKPTGKPAATTRSNPKTVSKPTQPAQKPAPRSAPKVSSKSSAPKNASKPKGKK